MKLTYNGHACFTLEHRGFRVVLDPFDDHVPGYPVPVQQAEAVYCSHGHGDHAYTQAITLTGTGENPFAVTEVATCHDDCGGEKRGSNTVRVLEADGIRVCHLGDLGHMLTPAQLAAIGPVDLLLVPVGGFYTIGPETAQAVCQALGAKAVVPMHYRRGRQGFDVIADVEDFLALRTDVVRAGTNRLELTGDLTGTILLDAPEK